ncbi:beta-ketoacyl-ACP synthase II [Lignipirellula cremea]|uniref:3-oxoacyl-[acyl-carrier-protein] synthase 2 n=1 Tax=Lignipirellula cremea TaxID=2528010 RepID=A0A518DVY9_9BACT|nr:beta-ketoacyl-ACP synthase II [Lignipirellula cremea]QDU96001.1 3-oxoacyl-[acyl-carrier-protein] synthase 2 [Lignipirellula cremea]
MKRRVVITGLGVVTSLSLQVDDLWDRVLKGESGIHPLQVFDTDEFKVKFGGDILNWDPSAYIPEREVKRLDRFTQLALVAGVDAVNDSGIDFSQYDCYRCGAILGSGIGGLNEIEEQMARLILKGPNRVSALTVPKMMLNAAGGNLSIKFNLRGPNFSVATACASATNAIGDAFKYIQLGDADVMITGGSEAAITRMGLSGFQNMRALSTRNEAPQQASRPFDRDRDGFVFSEGAGILIFEELEHARKRGARIYAEVLGYGSSGDAGHITSPDPYGAGAAKAMEAALIDGKLNPADVDYVNAHGTSTPLGDKAETVALKTVFGEHAYKMSISSTKSQLGHTLGASGGIEAVLCAKAIVANVVPPTINLDTPDPECDLDYTPHQPKERNLRVVMSNSFGFGGHNASVILGDVREDIAS